ncbi:MAG TPA: hypothetical protein VG435_13375 [Acidimicrobiales bacterium]|jgi:hypothetical protein|nr:hypothetical protein [Acidimicrobiales bacterium]
MSYAIAVTAHDGQTLLVGCQLSGTGTVTLYDDPGCTQPSTVPTVSAYRGTTHTRTFYVAAAGTYLVPCTDQMGQVYQADDVTVSATQPAQVGPFTPGQDTDND